MLTPISVQSTNAAVQRMHRYPSQVQCKFNTSYNVIILPNHIHTCVYWCIYIHTIEATSSDYSDIKIAEENRNLLSTTFLVVCLLASLLYPIKAHRRFVFSGSDRGETMVFDHHACEHL